jgi:hypothetical protein
MKLIDTSLINEKLLPDKIKIATISITCALNADINIREIWNFFPINDEIRTIKFNKQIKSTDSKLIEKERKKLEKKLKKNKMKNTKKRKTGDNFYNCIIIVVNISPIKIINIKLFKNGSIQMTGSKNLFQTETALKIVIKYLKMKFYKTINKKKVLVPFLLNPMSKLEEIDFIKENPNEDERTTIRNTQKLDFRKLKLFKFNINMINTSFALDFKIHLGELNKILEEFDDCIVTYEASIHAGINIKILRCSEEENIMLTNQIKVCQEHNEKCLLTMGLLKEKNTVNTQDSNTLVDLNINKQIEDIDNLQIIIDSNNNKIEEYKKNLEKKATILVFQSNDPKKMCNLIITGVTKVEHIIKAYKYITNIINTVKINIIKINVEELMEQEKLRLEEEEKLLSETDYSSDIQESSDSSIFSNNLFVNPNSYDIIETDNKEWIRIDE